MSGDQEMVAGAGAHCVSVGKALFIFYACHMLLLSRDFFFFFSNSL